MNDTELLGMSLLHKNNMLLSLQCQVIQKLVNFAISYTLFLLEATFIAETITAYAS